MRVMLAWQHGANLGHFSRLSALGRWAAEEGAVLLWAVPARQLHHPAWGTEGNTPRNARVVAPGWRPPARAGAAVSFAGVLEALGYADQLQLAAAVQRWWMLFERLRIERLVVDYAPAAMAAAAWAGLPVLHLTNGFDAPPPDARPFDLRLGHAQAQARHELSRAKLDQCLANVCASLKVSTVLSWDELLSRPTRMYDCVPEVDPFGPRPGSGHYVGPIGAPAQVREVGFASGGADRPKVFVYLRDASCHQVLEALTGPQWEIFADVICYWPEASAVDMESWRARGVALVNEPVAIDLLLSSCDLVVTYGAAAVTCRTLLAGVPQLVLPIDAEKDLIARRITATGAGMRLSWNTDVRGIATAVRQVLSSPAMRDGARAIQARYVDLPGHAKALLRQFLLPA